MPVRIFLFVIMAGLFLTGAARADLAYSIEKLKDGTQYMVVRGEFEDTDDAAKLTRANRKGVSFVTFDSPGGNIVKALQLGRLIRKLGLDTFQPRAMECASACTFAFLGGVRRSAEAGALGVHRSFFPDESGMTPGEAVTEMQAVTAQVVRYIAEMGADAALMELALSYDSGDMRYLSASEMARYRVTTPDGTGPGAATATADNKPAPDPAPKGKPNTAAPKADDRTADEQPTASDDSAPQPATNRPMPRIVPKGGLPREQRAVEFVEAFIAAHALSSRTALRKLADAYAEKVDYDGRKAAAADVLGEKETLFDEWPIRRYELNQKTVKVTCQPKRCKVSGDYDWELSSPRQKKQDRGTDSFAFTVETEDGLRISAEKTTAK